jgi:hypothetical protein
LRSLALKTSPWAYSARDVDRHLVTAERSA